MRRRRRSRARRPGARGRIRPNTEATRTIQELQQRRFDPQAREQLRRVIGKNLGLQHWLNLLRDHALMEEARREVEEEVSSADRERADRRKEALLLVAYNLAKLNLHITSSRRILNDLRTLRRLLLAERRMANSNDNEVSAAGD